MNQNEKPAHICIMCEVYQNAEYTCTKLLSDTKIHFEKCVLCKIQSGQTWNHTDTSTI